MSRFSGVWFPAALMVLLLLVVPGIILLIVTLTGSQGALNGWLQRNFNLSYHILLPWWAALLILLIPFLILLLYFLKMRRRPMQVPSTFLWKKSIEDLHVNSLFQWLRRNVLLLLQLLILLVLIYAMLGLRVYGRVTGGRHYVIMIDNSASMNVTAGDGLSRLEWARREALKEIDAAADQDFGRVIVFNSKATTLQIGANSNPAMPKTIQMSATSTAAGTGTYQYTLTWTNGRQDSFSGNYTPGSPLSLPTGS